MIAIGTIDPQQKITAESHIDIRGWMQARCTMIMIIASPKKVKIPAVPQGLLRIGIRRNVLSDLCRIYAGFIVFSGTSLLIPHRRQKLPINPAKKEVTSPTSPTAEHHQLHFWMKSSPPKRGEAGDSIRTANDPPNPSGQPLKRKIANTSS